MSMKLPEFVTKDLGDSEADAAEMMRRWQVYDQEMKALIAAGGAKRDADGWWVSTATGELIGPDPELERPRTAEEMARAKPLKDALPELHDAIQRSRGRPRSDDPRDAVTLRLRRSAIERWQRDPDWRAKMVEALEKDPGEEHLSGGGENPDVLRRGF